MMCWFVGRWRIATEKKNTADEVGDLWCADNHHTADSTAGGPGSDLVLEMALVAVVAVAVSESNLSKDLDQDNTVGMMRDRLVDSN